jgi:hypothetical protein
MSVSDTVDTPDSTADLDTPEATPEDSDKPESEETPTEDTPVATEDTEVSAEAAPDEAPVETPTEEEEADQELDDATLDALVDAYGERLRKTKGMETSIKTEVKAEVARQVQDYRSTTDSQSQIDQLINRGRSAAQHMHQLAEDAKTELGKASRNEEANPDVFNSQEFVSSLEQYGSATAMYERHVLETAAQDGFDKVFGDVLPGLSDEHAEELGTITNTVNRMRGDQNQFARADGYWMSELLNFVARRGMEHGAAQERTRVGSKKTVKESIARSNAVVAARAKIEADKGPPRAPKSEPRQAVPEFSEDGYQKMKEAGDDAKTQEYVNRWAARRGAGAAVSR